MMKTMNKLVSFSLLAFLLAITLIGCGGSTEDTLVGYDWVYPEIGRAHV